DNPPRVWRGPCWPRPRWPRVLTWRRMPSRAPAITAASTPCAGRGGRARDRSRGATSPTVGSCGRLLLWPRRPVASARSTRRHAAPASCVTPPPRRPASSVSEPVPVSRSLVRDRTWLVAVAASLWGLSALWREPLARDYPALAIVFWEH